MSHLANALAQLLLETNKTGADISRASGITSAQISRIRNGIQLWVAGDDLLRLANAFFPANPTLASKAHAQLLYARLHDECMGIGAKFISLQLDLDSDGRNSAPEMSSYKPVLPPKMQKNLDVIANHIAENRHVRDLIESIANLCRQG
ncbi:MAG: hypothetical protein WCK57_11290 [Verrucomicrobiae bacterium]